MKQATFLALLFLGVVLRVVALGLAPSNDEINLHWMMLSGQVIYPEHHAHPPLANAFFFIVATVFGASFWALRLVPMIFELLSLGVMYALAKQLYGHQIARIATSFGSFSFILIAVSSRLHIEPIAAFFFLMAVYLLVIERPVYAGIATGLLLLTKLSGVLVFPVLLSWSIMHGKIPAEERKTLLTVIIVSAVVFSLFPLWSWAVDSSLFRETLLFLFSFKGAGDNLPFGALFPFLFVFVTPFFLYLPLLSKRSKESAFLMCWVLIIVSFYLFVVKKGDYSRYFEIGMYPLLILGAMAWHAKSSLQNRLFFGVTLGSFCIFLFLQLFYYQVPRIAHSFSGYFQMILHGDFFFFPYVVDHGYGFGVVSPVFYAVAGAHIFLFVYCFWRKPAFFAVFFGVLFGFNLFLGEEMVFGIAQPSVSQAFADTVAYAQQHQLPEPYFSTDKTIMYAINSSRYYQNYTTNGSLFFNRIDAVDTLAVFQQSGGTLFFFPFAAYITEKEVNAIIESPHCTSVREWRQHGVLMSEIILCKGKT